METYRLRIELPDRPGALAAVTSILAEQGADVSSVDVHELDGATAVDEIVVQVGADWEASALAASLAQGGVASLLSSQRVAAPTDPVLTALRWCAAVVAADHAERDEVVRRAVQGLAHATAAWICSPADADDWEAGRMALDRRAPVVVRSEGLVTSEPNVPPTAWVLGVPDSASSPTVVALAVRPVSLRFSATEVARVEAILALRRSLVEAAAMV
jgi:predicted amino acid-binding ACT domain protein